VAWVLFESGSVLHQLRREVRATLEAAEALLSLTVKESPARRYVATILLGWIHAQTGRAVEGIAEIHRGLAAFEAQGFVLTRSQWLALLAEGYALAGRTEEGLGAIAEALEHVERTDERYYEAELHRLKGELLLQRGGAGAEAEAEACFQKGIEVARRQEARSWELRATMSLCRLWRSQGKIKEAREALAAIYGWFSEGFDTPDLQGAKALLEELGAGEEESTAQE
jgi:predicted ATPase